MPERLNAQQRVTAEAYVEVFKPGAATQLVLDDLLVYARSIPEPLARSGAMDLLMHVMLRRSVIRRERRERPTDAG